MLRVHYCYLCVVLFIDVFVSMDATRSGKVDRVDLLVVLVFH